MRYCGLQEYILTVGGNVFAKMIRQGIFDKNDDFGTAVIMQVCGWRAVELLQDMAGPVSPGAAVMFAPKRSHAKCYVGYIVRQKKNETIFFRVHLFSTRRKLENFFHIR